MRLAVATIRNVPGKEIKGTSISNETAIKIHGEDLQLLKPITVDYTAVNKGNYITVYGSIKAMIEFKCGRCLKKLSYDLDLDFSENFFNETQTESIDDESHV
ncbi:MAG: hypothetical protein SCK28_03585, partial [Bacillota bacterium]|nr:hypothetical protein [Bacillota bacterium]